jgi:ADP-ribose pyrophosphatase YjhB (NUDIX family)
MAYMKCRVRAVIELDGKCLLVKHVGHNTWNLPGGGMQDGEGLRQALEREIVEELGVKPVVGPLLCVHQFMSGGAYEGPEFYFRVLNPEDFVDLDPTITTHGPAEIAEVGFKDQATVDNPRPAFLATANFDDSVVRVVLE